MISPMARIFLILTVVAALLTCPLSCMAGAAGGKPHSQHCSCTHCRAAQPSSDKNPVPLPADDGGGCKNCLCHGAVVNKDGGAKVDCPLANILDGLCVLALDHDADQVVHTALLPSNEARPPSSGRSVRLLVGSLLL